MLVERSDWAAVNVELLTQALRLSSFKSKIQCEGTCKAWRKTLRDEPLEGIWGDMVSLQSLPCRLGVADFPGSNVLITQPSSSQQTVTLVSWLVQRVKGIKQVVLGNPQPRSVLATIPFPDPADDGSYSQSHLLLFLLSFADVEECLELVVCQMDPSLLLDMACQKLLRKHCVGLTLAAGSVLLSPDHVQAICSLTRLRFLELESNMNYTQPPVVVFPGLPEDMTKLTQLQTLTALCFPTLPDGFSSLRHLNKLYLAPAGSTPHDLSMHTQLTEIHIGTRYSTALPLTLPGGPDVALRSLILQSNCKLQNLGDAQQLQSLEVVPVLGLHMEWPASLPHLTRLVVDDPAELHGEEELWGWLPDQWQNYTALQQLSIPDLVLEALPEWIVTLSELRILEMQGISFNAHPYFPSCLRNMPKLQILNLERIDTFIVDEVICLAEIPNLLLLIFGCIGQDPNDDDPEPPLQPEEIQAFQSLATALAAHPNKLLQTALSQSSSQIWTFSASKHGTDLFSLQYLCRYSHI